MTAYSSAKRLSNALRVRARKRPTWTYRCVVKLVVTLVVKLVVKLAVTLVVKLARESKEQSDLDVQVR